MTPPIASIESVVNRMTEIRARVSGPPPLSGPFGQRLSAALAAKAEAAKSTASSSPATTPAAADASTAATAAVPVSLTTPGSVKLPSDGWQSALPEAAAPYVDMIGSAAGEAGIDPRFLASVLWTESGFNPRAGSSAGAQGIAQFMPATAAGRGVDPWNPASAIPGAAKFLAENLTKFGSYELAAAAYNAGPGRVAQAGGVPDIAETKKYVTTVMGRFVDLQEAS